MWPIATDHVMPGMIVIPQLLLKDLIIRTCGCRYWSVPSLWCVSEDGVGDLWTLTTLHCFFLCQVPMDWNCHWKEEYVCLPNVCLSCIPLLDHRYNHFDGDIALTNLGMLKYATKICARWIGTTDGQPLDGIINKRIAFAVVWEGRANSTEEDEQSLSQPLSETTSHNFKLSSNLIPCRHDPTDERERIHRLRIRFERMVFAVRSTTHVRSKSIA
jgi:hypothetical protein